MSLTVLIMRIPGIAGNETMNPRKIYSFTYLATGLAAAIVLNGQVALAQTRVQATPLQQLQISVNRSLPAESLSLRNAAIASELTSTVVELPLLVGDEIEQGQLIGRLDCADNTLELQQAKSELIARSANKVLAQQQLDRLNKLRASNNASEEQINQKQAELNVSTAQIKAQTIAISMAQRKVDKCEIRAPFSGVVTEIHTEMGNFVTPGTTIISLVDTDNIELNARVSIHELRQIRNADNLEFEFQDQTYPVRIRAILGVIDPVTQSQHMRLTFSASRPLPGSNGRLQWSLSGNIVPASLVVSRNEEHGVFTVDDSDPGNLVARFVPVPGVKQGQPAVVGLKPDSLIVTDGRFGLLDGDKIVID
jgi:RND family efflux transporter MFP subunit